MTIKATLASKLQTIRNLKSKGAGFEVQAMYEVLSLEKASVLWRRDGTESFATVLQEEVGLCTPSRFKAFKKAVEHFSPETIDQLGVPCVCLIAVQNQALRTRMVKEALAYRAEHGEPNYQFLSRFLRKSGKTVSRARLTKYIEVLKFTIKELGGRIPMME